MVVESLVNGSKNGLSDGGAFFNIVRSVGENLWFDNGNQPVLLANDGVTSQALRILLDGQLGRLGGADLEDSTPLGETSAGFVVLLAAGAERVEALSGGFAIGAG